MQARIVDIANKIGVSRSTVDRALHGRGRIDEELKQRILSTAKEMNYRPNTLARSLKTNRSGLIGVLMPTVMTSFFADIVQGISEASNKADYALLFCITKDQESVDKYVSVLLEKRVDGVIVTPFPTVFDSSALCQQLLDVGISVLSVTRPADHPNVSCVMSDNIKGGYVATQHLLQLGHSKIAFVSFSENDCLARQRYEGYLKAMADSGIEPRDQYYIKADTLDYVNVKKLMDLPDRPTAIFASTDFLTANIIEQLQEQGVQVPQDMSVIGFDDLLFCTMVNPKITTIRQPKCELGIAAFEQLKKMISGEAGVNLVLDVDLIVRGSTASIE